MYQQQQPGSINQQPGPGYGPGGPGYAPGPPGPVNYQPPNVVVMPANAAGPAGNPQASAAALNYLAQVDQLLIHEQIQMLQLFTGFEGQNKFKIRNAMGQEVFYAVESSDCCARQCFGSFREFNMKILDNYGAEVLNFYRPLRCSSCCFPCCLQTIEVMGPSGVLGHVRQDWSILQPNFTILDASGAEVLKIVGPICACQCFDVNFDIFTVSNGAQVGRISKQWSGLLREMFTDADNFGVSFPLDLDVSIKAVLLAAVFLIDFMYFEDRQRNNDN